MQPSNALLLLGAKGGAKMCIDIIHASGRFQLVGVVDSYLQEGLPFYGSRILGNERVLDSYLQKGIINIAVAFTLKENLAFRAKVIDDLKRLGFNFPNLIHPNAAVEATAKLGSGNIITNQCFVGSDCLLGDFNFLNPGSIVNHDVVMGNNNHISSGAVISGYAAVGNNNCIGINTVLARDFKTGDNQQYDDLTHYAIR